jgi:hypothetical protein
MSVAQIPNSIGNIVDNLLYPISYIPDLNTGKNRILAFTVIDLPSAMQLFQEEIRFLRASILRSKPIGFFPFFFM